MRVVGLYRDIHDREGKDGVWAAEFRDSTPQAL